MKIALYQDNYYKLPSHFKYDKNIRSLQARKIFAEVLKKNSIVVNNFNTSTIRKLIDACTDNEDSIILKTSINRRDVYFIVFKDLDDIRLSDLPYCYVEDIDDNRTFTINVYDNYEYIDYLDAHEWYNTRDLEL